jgi:hypothetical protein
MINDSKPGWEPMSGIAEIIKEHSLGYNPSKVLKENN